VAINKSKPMPFTPAGLTDAFDSTKAFPGCCTQLTNLVFDQVNREFVVLRPGVLSLAAFAGSGFTNPTFISIQKSVGTRVYGMVATTRNAGKDEPFCYENATGLFITISNVTNANTPTSPATTGDWTPPTLDVVGTMVVITHPGFNGTGANFYGIIDISNPAAPAWRDENTTTNLLPSVPLAVANFNNRAYFACANQVYYTDVLTNPLTMTNAGQAATIGDSSVINALAGLPIQSFGAGIVQSLTIFKKTTSIWQLTGDTTQQNLSLNFLSLTIGTISPRSVVQAPYGLYFISSSGPYFVDLLGAVRPVTNQQGESQPDIQTPFQNAVTPTRWAGAYNTPVYRVCGPTVINGVQSVNDYWFDEHRRRWNGPHSFAYDCASSLGSLFVLTSVNNPGTLIQCSPVPDPGFPITDLGVAMSFALQSSTFPKTGDMYTKQVAESQIELAALNGITTYTIIAQNEGGTQLGSVSVSAGVATPIWGAAGLTWGQAGLTWTSGTLPLRPQTVPIPWVTPLVFEKMQLNISGTATSTLGIGTFFARYQQTGYMTVGMQ
jgi:hypothetical protein